FATIANISLWETIRRSLATTFITLLPVGSLLFFGGDTLKDFAFALLVGITSGAYSSIFIAAPLLTMWKEREPDYARRVGQVEVRELIDQATSRWRGEAVRMGERAGAGLEGMFHQLGLVTRAELDELELRVAQLEHRLRLLESEPSQTLQQTVAKSPEASH